MEALDRCRRAKEVAADGRNVEASGRSAFAEADVVEARRKQAGNVESRLAAANLESARQLAGEAIEERAASFLVSTAHPSHVRGEMALGDEVGEGSLLERRDGTIEQRSQEHQRLDQVVRHDEV